ncbi:hypothetical protein Bbelb_374620 [Branchiostoma belcheri]|nr:hypothetical protein Bbelb_374620 [Branchiostoma belcheri]
MAKNLPSNTAPKAMDVRNEFFSESMAEPDTGIAPSTFRQATEGASHHISGECEQNKDNDDEYLSNTSDAAAENSQAIDIGSPGEFDAYAIAYTCKEQTIHITKAAVETKNKLKATKMAPDNSNDDDIHLARRGSINDETSTSTFKANDSHINIQARNLNPMYTQHRNPQPMDADNDVNPNSMYLQSIMEPNASPGPARNPNPMYTQNMNPQPMDAENNVNPNSMYLQSTTEPNASPGPARDPNPMYTHNAANTYPTHSRNDVNPNPMYLQSSPGPTFRSNKSENNPCTQTLGDAHQQGDEASSRHCTASGDTQASLSSQNLPAAASNSINDANALNPNLMYVPNAQRPAAHAPGSLQHPASQSICLDTSGRIIVANSKDNRVDMFTSQGEFVHTIAIITYPRGIAMGPCGELVVTSTSTNTVTIFPRANGASLKP